MKIKNLLVLIFLNLPLVVSADALQDIIQLRQDVERLSLENDKLFQRLSDEEDVAINKLSEIKNQTIKENLKKVLLEQNMNQYKSQRQQQKNQNTLVNSSSVSSLMSVADSEKMLKLVEKRLSQLSNRVQQSPMWAQDLLQLKKMVASNQVALFESKLLTFIEKKLYESVQIKKQYLAIEYQNEKNTFDVLSLGYFTSFAKNQSLNKYMIFDPNKGWVELEENKQHQFIDALFRDHKMNKMNFVSLQLFPELKDSKGQFYVYR